MALPSFTESALEQCVDHMLALTAVVELAISQPQPAKTSNFRNHYNLYTPLSLLTHSSGRPLRQFALSRT